MELQAGEAAILIIRRSETEPKKYFFAVRKSESSFSQHKDIQIAGFQKTELELGEDLDFEEALEKVISAIRELKP